jgi:hypothetical protein
MKTLLKLSFSLLFAFAIQIAGSAQSSQLKKDKPAAEQPKKITGKKEHAGTKNKIAVSDQAQPSDKSKKAAKKDNGATNK